MPVRGEISPRYARLEAWQVKKIAGLLPDLRLILTLRHPIERLWSQTLYDFGHLGRKDIREVSSLAFLRQLARARSQLSSDYFRIIKHWSAAFGREALHIGFFEQLRSDPQKFVDSVLRHIGASRPWPLPEKFAKKKVWATTKLVKHEREIPEVVHWYMATQLLKPTERLNDLLEGRVSGWVEELRTIASDKRPSWRVLREVNRTVLALPERMAYEAYHMVRDARLRLRWNKLRRQYVRNHLDR